MMEESRTSKRSGLYEDIAMALSEIIEKKKKI